MFSGFSVLNQYNREVSFSSLMELLQRDRMAFQSMKRFVDKRDDVTYYPAYMIGHE